MTQLPAHRQPLSVDLVLPTDRPQGADEELHLEQLWGAFRRHRWLLLACIVTTMALAMVKTRRTTPVYEATTSLRITEKAPNLPGFFRSLSSSSELSTEAEVLRSRTLAEDAVAELQLQLRVHGPRGAVRDELLDRISMARDATPGSYELRARPDGRFGVVELATEGEVATVAPGERLRLRGASFRLKDAVRGYERIPFSVTTAGRAAEALSSTLRVDMISAEVKILRVSYQDTDRGLVWQVPNLIVDRFIVRRNTLQKQEASSTVEFLRRQLDTIMTQLTKAEGTIRDYRERHLVVAPQAEASSQVSRLISMQAERTTLEGERGALAKLLEDVDAQAAAKRPGDPSPFRQLLAFPTLLRSQAAADLLSSLSAVEQERTALLARRTPQDPDVQALDARLVELEGQLRAVVAAYLQGLSNQLGTLDVGLRLFGAQLARLPQQELTIARLERQPKVLEEIYTLLQTRLKEAEIAQAVQDPSVSLVDRAIAPRRPFKPKAIVNLTAGFIAGLVLGVLAALVVELSDKAVRSRADVRLATGLPVLGLLPHMRRSGGRIPLFLERQALPKPRATKPKPYVPPARPRVTYTFLSSASAEAAPTGAADLESAEAAPPPPVLHLAVSDAGMPVAEAYGMLQTNISFAGLEAGTKVLVLTSPLPRDGKTTTAVNLALSLARRGLAVLLVDADLRRGMVHSAFGTPPTPGLSDVLEGRVPVTRAYRVVDVEGHELHYLASGSPAPNSSTLLVSDEMKAVLDRVRERYDTVIFDTPPTNLVTDAALLASLVDGVVLVVRAGVTETGALGLAMEQLRHVQAPLLGVILNDIDFKRDASYDGAYRYYDYKRYLGPTQT